MSTETELLATIQKSVEKIAETMAGIEASVSASDSLDIVSVLIAAVAAIAAAVATTFSWLSIKHQGESERRQYIWRMRARYASDDMQRDLDAFENWVSEHTDFLNKIRESWPNHTADQNERKAMQDIGRQSAVLYHFFKEIYDHYAVGFLNKKDLKEFRNLRAYDLLKNHEKALSKQFFKDFPPREPVERVNQRHEWIDKFDTV